jgi:hypothetical protein
MGIINLASSSSKLLGFLASWGQDYLIVSATFVILTAKYVLILKAILRGLSAAMQPQP